MGDGVMGLKRGEKVGERVIKKTTEQEVLQIIVSGVTRKNGETPPVPMVRAKVKPAAKRAAKK